MTHPNKQNLEGGEVFCCLYYIKGRGLIIHPSSPSGASAARSDSSAAAAGGQSRRATARASEARGPIARRGASSYGGAGVRAVWSAGRRRPR